MEYRQYQLHQSNQAMYLTTITKTTAIIDKTSLDVNNQTMNRRCTIPKPTTVVVPQRPSI
jgi:hypothetical protein